MSAPAIQAFMMVYAAKTAIEGIEEGNTTKAVMGAVGAYFGYAGLESLGTEAAASAAAEQTASAAAGEAAASGATAAATDTLGTAAAEGATSNSLGTVTAGEAAEAGSLVNAADTGTVAAENMGANVVPPPAGEEGFLDSVANAWNGMGDKAQAGLIQLGGNMLQGHAQEELLRDQWKREERLAAEERKRRGYSAPTGILGNYRYNTHTRRWEANNGAA